MSDYSHISHCYGDVHSVDCATCKKIDENYTPEEPIQQTDDLYCHDYEPEKKGGKKKSKKHRKPCKSKKPRKSRKSRKHRK